ncbi:hypothetical protein AU210_007016 [Fusarium oxysporum f. sp. radicis-cucumerinum]|uniref:Luciferase domain-containing protein n=2 Tax=Fusarium oxysporum TaxID=5507 RepID=A0A2H3HIH8_FUSOX|nr:hypothetical protein AU210_007016 [Fusarium oxysporum f. sp. radicis-cucumerinum]RKK21634.1 hypothetical protein BFJ65_g4270 [Fusarium oxysporum f. sp. cepae]RKK40501.1 hypothetical protein BFJ67_g10967 [Fusarium oxysporum f. sp. cepae]RKK41010.1 hypothetical protein BFJ66_g11239 [Fusarium oxysporum f. sp. cepae]
MTDLQHLKTMLERIVHQRPILIATTSGAAALVAFAAWCFKDYRDYLALGPGGPPYNVKGWAWITFGIRPFALSKSGATYVADYPTEGSHPEIQSLPRRQGERALLGGIAPHRQLSQHAPTRMRTYIENLFTNAARQHPTILETKKSLYERHHDALFVSHMLLESQPECLPNTAIIARGELGHVHPDLSVHLYLSPADARVIIEKGWAERHRLSVPETSWVKNKYAIASTYLMIYGPRDEAEMEVLRVILESSIGFMTGQDEVEKVQWKDIL